MQREISKKTNVSQITKSRYFSSEGKCYVITPLGEKVFRVNIIATITDRFTSESGNYSSITIDDGSDAIRVKAFRNDVKKLDGLEKGDLVVVIGTVGEYQNEIYVNAETVKQVEPNYKILRKLELIDHMRERRRVVDNFRKLSRRIGEAELKEYGQKMGIDVEAFDVILESAGPDHKPTVLKVISELDKGEGAEIGKIFETVDLPDNVLESVMDDLIAEGYLYEPTPGKFKRV